MGMQRRHTGDSIVAKSPGGTTPPTSFFGALAWAAPVGRGKVWKAECHESLSRGRRPCKQRSSQGTDRITCEAPSTRNNVISSAKPPYLFTDIGRKQSTLWMKPSVLSRYQELDKIPRSKPLPGRPTHPAKRRTYWLGRMRCGHPFNTASRELLRGDTC
ncbi:hypothetical protein PISMIDRAFT_578188 [Pisolithus microcarpus 441]|uniref:Uncharacterized protein n=1 Tax=Pisolithus microcarpus 441 TaxID=765257 RepID=A0A0C9ZL20_9AGAM|nr:hypothetical protein PISMIDRAFT_578188 [Pisolithus microcarpus 441]